MHSTATAPAASPAGSFLVSAPGARIRAYIDGLNLFYGALKGKGELKWLDVVALCDALRGAPVDHVRYFNSTVSGRYDPGCPLRQNVYLRALDSHPRLTYHPGKFRANVKWMPLAASTSNPPESVQVWRTEEKQSDVNLGTMLLMDGVDGLYDEAIVICNDSDLTMPIKIANERYGPIHVFRPTRDHLNDLAKVAATYAPLPVQLLATCQMPSTVQLRNGRQVSRPTEWR